MSESLQERGEIEWHIQSFKQFWLSLTCAHWVETPSSKSPKLYLNIAALLRRVDRGVAGLFLKININWAAVSISICLHMSEWQICIFRPLPDKSSFLRFAYPRLKKESKKEEREREGEKDKEKLGRQIFKTAQTKSKLLEVQHERAWLFA